MAANAVFTSPGLELARSRFQSELEGRPAIEGEETGSRNQACDIAAALDLVGRRWALQVVHELLRGPRRFTDLQRALTAISTNVLAARLRELQQANVVHRRFLPPPAASTVYELTDHGRELEEIVLALGQWGAGAKSL